MTLMFNNEGVYNKLLVPNLLTNDDMINVSMKCN